MRFKNRFVLAAAFLLILSISAPQGVDARGPALPGNLALSLVRIDNFGRVSPTYYRGAQPAGLDYAALKALGIRTVIDLQEDGPRSEEGLVRAAGMTFHRIPLNTRIAPTRDQVGEFMNLVTDPAAQPVYVHCAGGRHRTGVMTAVYRMTVDQWSADRAFREMKDYKFGLDFLHPELKAFVYSYYRELGQRAAM